MTARANATRVETGYSLPAFDRLAPAPSAALLAARIDAHTGPGDVVADLAGRGGWVARAALDRQRRAVSIESTPLTRMLAEVVLRPPDVRHLDAAFQGMAASPRRESSLKVSVSDLFATRCATCGRMLVADEFTWSAEGEEPARPVARHYRCTVCRDQRGGSEQRQAELEPDDRRRAMSAADVEAARAWARERFPLVEGAPDLVDELLDLHTPRQLIALTAIMERIEADLRAAPVLAALRLAFLHAIIPASRLATGVGRGGTLRVIGGHVRLPGATTWRERNPWLAFEESFRAVRGFVQRLEGGALGPMQARLGEDLRSLGEGSATAVLAVASPSAVRALSDGGASASWDRSVSPAPRVRLVLGQPPIRPSLERLAAAYHGTAWTLGREAASLLPVDALAETSLRAPWSWQAVAISRSLASVEPSMARDGRVVQLVDGGMEALAAVAIGGASAGYRVVVARLSDPDDASAGVIELVPPGAAVPPGARTRANVGLPAVPGGAGDPDMVPGRGLFAPPERFDQRPFSPADAARVVTDSAVETLRARGEPARMERLFGEILVGLDRSGHLRRLASGGRLSSPGSPGTAPRSSSARSDGSPAGGGTPAATHPPAGHGTGAGDAGGIQDPGSLAELADPLTPPPPGTGAADPAPATGDREGTAPDRLVAADRSDPVDRLLALIRDELQRPDHGRLVEIEPGRWWLDKPADREAAAPPLADRVEWAVFSLLSTAGPLSETAFYERMAGMFAGHDLPDETLVRACLQSYRSMASTPDRLVTSDDLLKRSQEHTALLADLAEAGHRLGMRVWLAEREQARRHAGATLGALLDERERNVYLGSIGRSPEDLADVDAIWYIRSKVALLFEVEWTAILGEPLLRRHTRIGADDRLVRFLAIAPERTDLVRYKLERSPLLRAALDEGGWTIIKWDHLRTFLSAEKPDLADLEPLVGLDPVVERGGEQMPLFGG